MHTRSTASRRRSAATRATTTWSDFGSMLKRASGNSSSSSSSVGIGSVPPMRAWRTSLHGQLGEHAGAIGDPVQFVVVERDQHAVGGQVHIGLEIAEAHLGRGAERCDGVLRRGLGAAAVGDGERAWMFQVRVHGHGVRVPAAHMGEWSGAGRAPWPLGCVDRRARAGRAGHRGGDPAGVPPGLALDRDPLRAGVRRGHRGTDPGVVLRGQRRGVVTDRTGHRPGRSRAVGSAWRSAG